ncbi:MAG: PilZ domain-containing protein [Acidobacteriota bacterium]
MPELLRSVVSRVRVYVQDRRQSPRLRVRLLFTVSISRKVNGNGSPRRERIMKGHTRDISISGLALNVPQVHLDGHHLAAEGRELELKLELPGGPISMLVVSRRYERLEEPELGCNYLIGARIVQIDDEDRQRYMSFITEGLERA